MSNYLAYCGLYCGACCSMIVMEKQQGLPSAMEMNTVADEQACPGCDNSESNTCEFAVCNREHGTISCAFCAEFPCPKIQQFSIEEWEHHKCVIANLTRMREIGADIWLEEQAKHWQCPECGCRVQWYQESCSRCNADVSHKSQW